VQVALSTLSGRILHQMLSCLAQEPPQPTLCSVLAVLHVRSIRAVGGTPHVDSIPISPAEFQVVVQIGLVQLLWLCCWQFPPEVNELALVRQAFQRRLAEDHLARQHKAAILIQSSFRKHILRRALLRAAKQYRKEVGRSVIAMVSYLFVCDPSGGCRCEDWNTRCG
jgi:hypothetical protein